MTRRHTLEPLSHRRNRLLEAVRLPELHVRIYTLPPNEDRKHFTLLMLVL